MGLFDWVDFEMDCPNCGHKLKEFQTKDGDNYMNTVDAFYVDRFYTACDNCGMWIEFLRKSKLPIPFVVKRSLTEVLEFFEMRIEKET